MKTTKHRVMLTTMVAAFALAFYAYRISRPTSTSASDEAPVQINSQSDTRDSSIEEILQMANDARKHMAETLDQYSARFVKLEADSANPGEETVIQMKVQTRLRGDTEDAPMRVYLDFQAPESVKGREVIWCADLHDGKLVVHDVGLKAWLGTLYLDPNGMLAMQGQRYPISEIGLVKLVEKLIERGEQDRDNPDVKVTITDNHVVGTLSGQLIQVRRTRPSNTEDDFSLAEILIDPERKLIVSYRSFGWPDVEGDPPPMQESYTYHDIDTTVEFTEADFDPKNPAYRFP